MKTLFLFVAVACIIVGIAVLLLVVRDLLCRDPYDEEERS